MNRVLIVGCCHFPFGTAPASRILNMALGLQSCGAYTDVVALYPPPLKVNTCWKWIRHTEFIRYLYINDKAYDNKMILDKLIWYLGNWNNGLKISKFLKSSVSNKRYSAIIVYGRNYSILSPIVKIACGFKVPVITDLVELPKTVKSRLYFFNPIHLDQHMGVNFLLKKSSLITVISRFLEEFVDGRNKTYLLPSIQNWTKSPKVNFGSKSEGNDKNYQVLVYVGNLIPRDSPRVLFEFIKQLVQKLNIRLYLVGRFMNNKNGKRWIEELENDNHLSKYIKVVGEVNENEKLELYERTSAFILPRRNNLDEIASFPTRLIEYLKENKVVIASPVGDIPYHFNKNEIIFLDHDNLSSTVKSANNILTNSHLYDKMAKQGKTKAQNICDAKNHMKIILAKVHA